MGAPVVVRVAPDAGALDKRFDYLVGDDVPGAEALSVGAEVRIDLHGRRLGGWVVALGVEPPDDVALRPVARVRGYGPPADLVELADWAAWRWAGRPAALLSTASPTTAVRRLPAARLRQPAPPTSTPVDLPDPLPSDRPTLVRLAPGIDPTPLVAAAAALGPTLVVVPSLARAAALAGRLARAGGDVAMVPDGWAQARAGAAVVVGARAAAWAPCPGLAAAVVVDGHDEALVQEQAPTWSAVEVVAERARRAGAPCLITSPWPTAGLVAACGAPVGAPAVDERAGWAPVDVVDMREVDPQLGLWSEPVTTVLRSGRPTLVVLNRTGRARLLACVACRSVARCERCDAAVALDVVGEPAVEVLGCPRCGLERPVVCATCGSTRMRRLRIGVSRAREQLEALTGRPVGEVTSTTSELPDTDVLVGTEALLRRARPGAATVVFADLDAQLLAPRYRAAEEVGGLLALASRVVGGRRSGGRLLLQTRSPEHPVVAAARAGVVAGLADDELDVRRALALPPAAALAVVTGEAAAAFAGSVRGVEHLVAGDRHVLRAATHRELCDALAATARPPGRLRVEVDPLAL